MRCFASRDAKLRSEECGCIADVVDCPEYVRWRFPLQRSRYLGTPTTHAFSRLWWSSELFRRGSAYRPASEALRLQEIPNTVLRLVAVHNMPFCAALMDFIVSRRSDHQRLIGRQINRLSMVQTAVLRSGTRCGRSVRRPERSSASRLVRAACPTGGATRGWLLRVLMTWSTPNSGRRWRRRCNCSTESPTAPV